MPFEYGLNGYVLQGTTQVSGIWLLDATEYAPALSARRAVLEVPQRHYSIPLWDDPMSEVTLGLSVRVKGADAEHLRVLWNTLIGLLGMGTNQPIKLTRHRGTLTDAADGQLVSTTTPTFNYLTSRADVQMVLNIPGGAWRSPTTTDQSFAIGSNYQVNVANQSTRPISDAMIRIQGPVGTVTITDNISGTGITWNNGALTVPVGNYLLIDVATMVAKIVTTNTWDINSGTAASARLAYTGYGPLTLTSRRTGATGAVSSSLSVAMSGGTGPVVIRAKSAVV